MINVATKCELTSFQGACLDTGACTSVCGRVQAEAYAKLVGFKFNPKPSARVFRFGGVSTKSLGAIHVRIPIPGHMFIQVHVDVVEPNVPLLIGLDALDKHSLYINNVRNLLLSEKFRWGIPLQHKNGHLYLQWGAEVLFTIGELKKMHNGFFHPSTEKLFNLIRRAKPEHATTKTQKLLEQVSAECKTCQYHAPRPLRFAASIPGPIVFNRLVILDLMWINRKPLLHVIDADTHYSSARFLPGESTKEIWETFLHCWTLLYTGFPDSVKADSGSVFTSKEWNKLVSDAGIAIEITPVESSNSMGVGERYHDPLRRIFRKVTHGHPGYPKNLVLAIANKAMNDTMGPEGIVPSLLVFGNMPRFPASPSQNHEQSERIAMMQTARLEMEKITSRLRIKKVLKTKAPKAVHAIISEGDPVLIWRKANRPSKCRWTGPFEVIKIEGKVITVVDESGKPREFNASSVKLYTTSEQEDIDNIQDDFEQESSSEEEQDDPKDPDYSEDSDDDFQNEQDAFSIELDENGEIDIHLTEELTQGDPRALEERFKKAKLSELKGLTEMRVWDIVDEKKVPRDANILGSRMILAIKDPGTSNERAKARLVVQGYKDRDKFNLVHSSTNLQQRSIRIICSIAAIMDFELWSHDITQAYLQSDMPLQRQIFMKPPSDLCLPKEKLLQILKPLYGLAESGDYWNSTNSLHHVHDLGMKQACGDLSLYYRRVHGKLEGISGIVVDDTLQCGTKSFWNLTSRTMERFRSKERTLENILFAGIQIDKRENGFFLSQGSYSKKLSKLPKGSDYNGFRSIRAKLLWLCNSPPDIVCATSMITQVTEGSFSDESMKKANKIISHIQTSPNKGLLQKKLDFSSISIFVYKDSSFGNNDDLSSQLGYIITLQDKFGNAAIIDYASKKCRRVTRSFLAGEVMAFTAGFDAAFIIKYDLSRILNRRLSLYMITDSRGLFDMITRNSYSAEKRLMIDLAALRESYRRREIDSIAHIQGKSNPADALTKITHNVALNCLMDGIATVRVNQWIVRSSEN